MSAEPEPQALVDALGVALGRPVLLDDADLVPLAYSRQWDVDPVRNESILGRGASVPVREALLAQGIAAAADVVRTAADPALGMEARVCLPVRAGGETLGYLWLLDPEGQLSERELERLRGGAAELAAALAHSERQRDSERGELVAALRDRDSALRERAATAAVEQRLLPDGPAIFCLLAAARAEDSVAAAASAARRLSVGHAIFAAVGEGAALVLAAGDPVLATLGPEELGRWLQAAAGGGIAVGLADPAPLGDLDQAARQAGLALRVARARGADGVAAWGLLGADRILAQLPPQARADLPPRLTELLRDEPELARTLTAFLDAAGDVKAVAAALSLHRSGVYYRLHRIEELTDLDLGRGDDRLLAQLAIRLLRLSASRP